LALNLPANSTSLIHDPTATLLVQCGPRTPMPPAPGYLFRNRQAVAEVIRSPDLLQIFSSPLRKFASVKATSFTQSGRIPLVLGDDPDRILIAITCISFM
jgi:hypothetical protein